MILPAFRTPAACAALLLLVVLLSLEACSKAAPTEYGKIEDSAPALPITMAVSSEEAPGHTVLVEGRIAEVCRSAGCWLVLEDMRKASDGVAPDRLYVDLKPAATFTIPADLAGRRATVTGTLHGDPPDRKLHAVGLRLVADR